MDVLVIYNYNPTEPLVIQGDVNVVVLGKLQSDVDMVMRVNNLVVIGEVIGKLTLNTDNLLVAGSMELKDGTDIVANNTYQPIVSEEAIEKVRAMGIKLTVDAERRLSLGIPRSIVKYTLGKA